ncbi:MAG: ATP-binding cassette domain-containing protein [Burkholderiales bacterium]
MIALQGVAKRFHSASWPWLAKRPPVEAVRDVSLLANNGTITGLLGPNGAGKTTTLRMLAGLMTPDAGTLEVDGYNVQSSPHTALARLGVLSDAQGLYPRLTARENILYYARLRGLSEDCAHHRVEILSSLLDLKPWLNRRTEGFSQGERLKTSVARALVNDPPNIILDEPTNGLDVLATRALRDTLRLLRSSEGGRKCIVLSTHIMQEVAYLCDSVVIVSKGRSVACGTVESLQAETGQAHFEDAFVKLAFSDRSEEQPSKPTL